MYQMSKEYLEREYRAAVDMFMLAVTEDEQWKARRIMAETERSAIEQYGTEYAEELHQLTKLINKA